MPREAGPAVGAARAEDADDVWAMRRSFFEDQIAKGLIDRPASLGPELRAATEKIIANKRSALLLARIGGAPAGYCYAIAKSVPATPPQKIASVEEFYVDPGFRKRGVSHALFQATREEFAALGADRVQLRVLSGNAEGHGFWASVGFEPAVTIYELKDWP